MWSSLERRRSRGADVSITLIISTCVTIFQDPMPGKHAETFLKVREREYVLLRARGGSPRARPFSSS
jgi:hypothetical protein